MVSGTCYTILQLFWFSFNKCHIDNICFALIKKQLAIFAVLSVASAQHWNNPNWAVGPAAPVQDTPEVAAAKAAHFAALARVQPQSQQQAQ